MEGMGEEGQLLQSARNKAALVVEQYEPTDQFQVITNEFSGRDQSFLTRDQAVERIEGIRPSHQTQPLVAVLERIENQLGKADGSPGIGLRLQRPASLNPSACRLKLHLRILPSSGFLCRNWLGNTPEHLGGLGVVRRTGAHRGAASGSACAHATQLAGLGRPHPDEPAHQRRAGRHWDLQPRPGIPTDTVLRFTHGAAGIQSASVEIDDAPIRFDDQWHFGYDVLDQINILVLSSGDSEAVNTALRRAFNTAGGLYRVAFQNQWSPGDFAGHQVVVLHNWPSAGSGFNNALLTYIQDGGTAVYMPTPRPTPPGAHQVGVAESTNWIEQSDRVDHLQMDHPFFKDMFAQTPERIDLPSVESIWSRGRATGEEILATTEAGRTYFSRIPDDRGQLFILNAGASAEATNLIRHAFWVPLMLRIAERSSSHAIYQAELGVAEALAVNVPLSGERNWSMDGPLQWGATEEGRVPQWLPEVREFGQRAQVNLTGVPFETGHYNLKNGEVAVAAVGLNQDRAESDHLAWDVEAFEAAWNAQSWPTMRILAGTSSTLPQIIQRMEQGVPLWKALLLLAVAALAAETLFLRLWKPSSKA